MHVDAVDRAVGGCQSLCGNDSAEESASLPVGRMSSIEVPVDLLEVEAGHDRVDISLICGMVLDRHAVDRIGLGYAA